VNRTFSKLLLTLFACAIGVACGEIALRAAGPHWLRARMQELGAGHPILGETSAFDFIAVENGRFTGFRPRSSFLLLDGEFRTAVHITDWGTRATGADAAGPDTVVFVGDSFTFGYGVNDDETFVSRACRARRAACLDAAFPGSTLSMHLDLVERGYASWGHPRRIVFVFFAGNDLPELVADLDRGHAPRPTPPAGRRALVALNRAINGATVLRRSYVIQLVKSAARARVAPDSMDLMFVTAAGAHGAFGARAEAALDATLDRLAALSARLGFTASFLLLPDRLQLYRSAMEDKARYYGLDPSQLDMQFPQRLLGRQLDRRGIVWLDVLPCLDPADGTLYYQRDNHLTAGGHEAVARCMLKAATLPL
jgi:hypothetical protein